MSWYLWCLGGKEMKHKINIKTLKEILKFQGRKSIWLASVLGVTPETLSLWLNGQREFPTNYIAPLAVALGVPISWLVK